MFFIKAVILSLVKDLIDSIPDSFIFLKIFIQILGIYLAHIIETRIFIVRRWLFDRYIDSNPW